MMRVEKLFKSVVSFLILSLAFPVFAEVTILSPASSKSRTWSNKQVLVINATEGEEVFYSFSDEDPMKSGFAYDGPVPLDLDGTVKLNIATIKNKKRVDYILAFDVDLTKKIEFDTLEEKQFIDELSASPIYDLPCGKELRVPSGFEYLLSSSGKEEDFEAGRSVYISKDSTLERFLTLTLKTKNGDFYNFVIHVVPEVQGEFTKDAVPFEFEQWSKIKLVNHKYIYSIDGQWWQGAGDTIELDRTVPHVIKWQDVDYDITNPISSYEIPPTPVIRAETQADSSIILSLNGDESYRFAKGNNYLNNFLPNGLFKEIKVDAFQGENFSTLLPLDVYSDNVLQGTLYVSVQVNRKIPKSPVIVLPYRSEIYRDDISIYFTADKDDYQIKYLVEGPFYKKNDDIRCTEYEITEDGDFLDFKTIEAGKVIELKTSYDKPCAYKVSSYVIDSFDNISKTVTEFIEIDKCNYYVNPKAGNSLTQLGTVKYPLSNLDLIEEIIKDRKYTNFYIDGEVHFINEVASIKENVKFSGNENSKIIFGERAGINVFNSSLEIINVVFDNVHNESSFNNSFITLNNSTLEIRNSELNFARERNATLINARKSTVTIYSSGLTTSAAEYACAVSGLSSTIAIVNESRVTTNAATNVNFSVKKSAFGIDNSTCKVSGLSSRIAELYSSKARFYCNTFLMNEASVKAGNSEAVWKDKNSSFTFYSLNTVEGYSE
ncbi:MAG: hypothetical protein KBS84_05830 [Treponema sp.]|nr:hypothetical protein [Candidatus Treponema scatequi]